MKYKLYGISNFTYFNINPTYFNINPTLWNISYVDEYLSVAKRDFSRTTSPLILDPSLEVRDNYTTYSPKTWAYCDMGVSINGGTPSHHPFLDGIFHSKAPIWRSPMTMETPI